MIVFIHVSKRYPTGQTALSDVSFEVQEGEFVFFVGESGAGKTTIMRLLTRDMRPTDGTVVVLGEDLTTMKRNKLPQLRRNVSVIFQDYKLLPDRTVAENVGLALEIIGMKKEEIQSRVKDLLQLVNLNDKENYFPRQLSGGEAQRVSIARALAIGPKVIFADEPTGNLDHESAMQVAKLLEKINELGTTILMATHNLDIVKALKKREIHLHKGQLVSDTKKAVIAKPAEATKAPEPKHEQSKSEEVEESVKADEEHVEKVEALVKPDKKLHPRERHSRLVEKEAHE